MVVDVRNTIANACTAGIILAAAGTACHKARPSWPIPNEIIEYTIPWENAFPSDVVVDTAGRVWFTDRIVHVVGRYDPATGEFSRFEPPTPRSAPYGLIGGPDGGLWYAASRAGLIGRVDPETGAIEEYPIRGAEGGPQQLTLVNGIVWFSLRDTGSVGRLDPVTGASRLIHIDGGLRPYGVAVAPGGHIWYSSMDNGYLIEVDPVTDSVRIHDLGEPAPSGPFAWVLHVDSAGRRRAQPIADSAGYAALPDSVRERASLNRVRARGRRLAADSAGGIWLTDFRGSRIIRFDPALRTLVSYRSLARGTSPYGIALTRGGMVVYSETGADAITILDPETGERTTLRLPTQGGTVRQICIDEERGNVWLPLSDAGKLAVARVRREQAYGVDGAAGGDGPGPRAVRRGAQRFALSMSVMMSQRPASSLRSVRLNFPTSGAPGVWVYPPIM